jgi:hypothetical protein
MIYVILLIAKSTFADDKTALCYSECQNTQDHCESQFYLLNHCQNSFFYVCVCKDPIIDQCFLWAGITAMPATYFKAADGVDIADFYVAIAKSEEPRNIFTSDDDVHTAGLVTSPIVYEIKILQATLPDDETFWMVHSITTFEYLQAPPQDMKSSVSAL